MVSFVSLFLWLMTDIHPVKVAVGDNVATVEIFLDSEPIGVATGPDWEIPCDFGQKIRPHELTAVAKDDMGAEIGRARQLVNLPRADAEVEIVLEAAESETPGKVRIISVDRSKSSPLAIFVTFDGLSLSRHPDGGFVLPDYDPRLVHIVSAEAHYPENLVARADVTFGGTYGGRVTTELTAVPLVAEGRRQLQVGDLQGLMTVRGKPLLVAAVERTPAQVFVVRDHSAWPALTQTGVAVDRRHNRMRSAGFRMAPLLNIDNLSDVGSDVDRFFLVVANASESRGIALYPIVKPFDIDHFGLPWLVTHVSSPTASIVGQRVAEAVAVAGVRAAAGASPRAVVVILSEGSKDVSYYRPTAVREYLRALRVPLHVWSTEGGKPDTEWGRAEDVDDERTLQAASKRLLKNLRRQWIVWVEGRYLPSDIELADSAEGFKLAGEDLEN